jgi:hypothetical protein
VAHVVICKDMPAPVPSAPVVLKANMDRPARGEDGTWLYTASNEAVDRTKDIMDVESWRVDEYRKNPVVLWAHNKPVVLPPIGMAPHIRKDLMSAPRALRMGVKYMTPSECGGCWPESAPAPWTIEAMTAAGYLRGCSVGFKPDEKGITYDRDQNTGEMLARRMRNNELLELSVVPIPCNAGALVQCMSRGWLMKQHLADVFASCLDVMGMAPADKGDAEIMECVTKEMKAPKLWNLPADFVVVTKADLRDILNEAVTALAKSASTTVADSAGRAATPPPMAKSRAPVFQSILVGLKRDLDAAKNNDTKE